MSYTPATLASLLKNLSISDSEPDHEAILQHAEGTLNSDPANELAVHTKAVALLYLDRYQEASELLEKAGLKSAALERAYALYKIGKVEDVSAISSQVEGASPKMSRGLKHVEAQAVWDMPPL